MVTNFVLIFIAIILIALFVNVYEEIKERKGRMMDISFRESLDLTDLPVITFYNNNRKINFLLDTGANNSVIDSNILDNYNYESNGITGNVTGMEGNTIETTYVNMNLEYNGLLFKDEFQSVNMKGAFDKIKQDSGVTINGILGNIFFRKYRYILDFDTLKAYIKN